MIIMYSTQSIMATNKTEEAYQDSLTSILQYRFRIGWEVFIGLSMARESLKKKNSPSMVSVWSGCGCNIGSLSLHSLLMLCWVSIDAISVTPIAWKIRSYFIYEFFNIIWIHLRKVALSLK